MGAAREVMEVRECAIGVIWGKRSPERGTVGTKAIWQVCAWEDKRKQRQQWVYQNGWVPGDTKEGWQSASKPKTSSIAASVSAIWPFLDMNGLRCVAQIPLCFTTENISTKERKATCQWPQNRIRVPNRDRVSQFLHPELSSSMSLAWMWTSYEEGDWASLEASYIDGGPLSTVLLWHVRLLE